MLKNLIRPAFVAFVLAAATASPLQQAREQYTTVGSSPPAANTFTPEQIKEVQQELILSPSYEDREAILFTNPPDATNITFQFVNATHHAPTGGEIILTTVDTFPALIGTNVGAAIGFVDACGLNVPHSHPRANEFLTVVNGTLMGGLMLETTEGLLGNTNGTNPTAPVPMVSAMLTNFTGMLFPQGQVHFQFNPTCEPAVFAAAFDSADSGRTQIANTFFSIQPDDVLIAALGGSLETLSAAQIDKLRGNIPDAFAELMDDCAKTCGIPTS
jgi:oxalate decarboxylase/phosphoglucose isomerase-like protein (cupin superfamily)